MAKYSKGQKKIANLRKQKKKYPSILEDLIEKSDIILEVLDARFIQETRNLELEKLIKRRGKKIIYVLNKADLIDRDKIKKSELKDIYPHVFISCTLRQGTKVLRELIKREAKRIPQDKQGYLGRIAVGVLGYPNTGKSSMINLLVGKSVAGTGADAGFTKGMQKLKLTSEIVLLDTPGVIPQQEYSSSNIDAIAQHTKVGGRSYSQIRNPGFVIHKLMRDFPEVFEKFYNLDADGDSETLIEMLGQQKGFMKKGKVVDEDKTARFILKDWQTGKIKV